MKEDSESDSGSIISKAVSESDAEAITSKSHNAEFFDFICSGADEEEKQLGKYKAKLHRGDFCRQSLSPRRQGCNVFKVDLSDDDDNDDPLVRFRSHHHNDNLEPRRSRRIRTQCVSRLELEEDGTFLIPSSPSSSINHDELSTSNYKKGKKRIRRGIRKSPRFLREISYAERKAFSTESSDQEKEDPPVNRTKMILRNQQGLDKRAKLEECDKNITNHDFGQIENVTAAKITGKSTESVADQIAGMNEYILKLKEMIIFPLLYAKVFSNLGISPPRGVLFHGPPGTGKTLLARLLAESCSVPESGRTVSFFMKNGSDCLSKWIGEGEKNLRLLFKKAREQQPSIIFFDEIDGLAPERTGKQDQSHISLVATLLALMDGLDDRGNVVVIGATNRINSIDPALRRPGRFDREFFFDLPNRETRRNILKLHTASWDPPIDDNLLDQLANETAEFSGADLKALCVEAALRAMRRACPRAYDLHLPPPNIEEVSENLSELVVTSQDFQAAYTELIPSTSRRYISLPPLSGPLKTLLGPAIEKISSNILSMIVKAPIGGGSTFTWKDVGRTHFVQPIVSYCFSKGPLLLSQHHIKRIMSDTMKNIGTIRNVIIDLNDLLIKSTDILLRYLKDSLPPLGGIVQICGFGTILMDETIPEDIIRVTRQFVKDVFYNGSNYLLVLADPEPWDTRELLKLDWDTSHVEVIIQRNNFENYLEEVFSEFILSPQHSFSSLLRLPSSSSNIDFFQSKINLSNLEVEISRLRNHLFTIKDEPLRLKTIQSFLNNFLPPTKVIDGNFQGCSLG